MPSSAFWAFGSSLQMGDGATTEVFTTIAEITDLVPPQMERDSDEVTHYASADGYKEFIPVLRDGGEVDIECNWLPNNATHDETTGLNASFNDNLNHNWRIVLPDSIATIPFRGHITAFKPGTPLNGHGNLKLTIKVTGKPPIT